MWSQIVWYTFGAFWCAMCIYWICSAFTYDWPMEEKIGESLISFAFLIFGLILVFAPCSEEYYCCKFFSSIRFFLQQTQKEILDKNKEIQKLENELIEREEFKEFQNKSVEYQQSSKNKMKELERKVVNLFKDLEQKYMIVPLEDIKIEDIGEGTSNIS
ncbi:hypothetical protein C2G38_2080229 [Gigaspora rosea]|uniref:Uncharacterized protein n=1 Tax=Gigaspora rosea TaxID=44941 RepID=A0A397VLE2_9GLOM|nr:hypothetical protein C2G38_2080229 [Gigaspora rosea]